VLAVLDVPVLAELLAAAVLREAEEEAAGERDPGALVAHDRPPLDDHLVPLGDRLAEEEVQLLLGGQRSAQYSRIPSDPTLGARKGLER
jgi:hypothetical protein